MTELFIANLHIIQQRWPVLASILQTQQINDLDAKLVNGSNQTISVNNMQLSSRHDRLSEAKLIIDSNSISGKSINLYGIGMGDIPSQLIDIAQLEHINIYILNYCVFALVLNYTDQSEWLSNEKVQLRQIETQDKIQFPYLTLLPELNLASDENAMIRDLLVYDLNLNHINQKHQADDTNVINRFNENKKYIESDSDAANITVNIDSKNILVVGTGPTLEQHYTYIKSQLQLNEQRPLIIAADTAYKALIANDIQPDIVVSIDHKISQKLLPSTQSSATKLVYFPRVPSETIGAWMGKRYCAYATSPLYDNLNSQYPRLRLFSSGSVIHTAIDLAVFLKAESITLFGCDFCFVDNNSHAFWGNGEAGLNACTAKHWVFDGNGNKASTNLNFRAYLRALEIYIKQHPNVAFYQSNLKSAKISGAIYKECF